MYVSSEEYHRALAIPLQYELQRGNYQLVVSGVGDEYRYVVTDRRTGRIVAERYNLTLPSIARQRGREALAKKVTYEDR